MAERRMFAKTIIDSDAFLDMPMSAQALYFHLSMRADDDGFINNPKKIQRMVGATDDDLKILIMKSFIITFDNGVVVIKHWRIHNYIRGDRKKNTVYREEMALLSVKDNGAYTINDGISLYDNQVTTKCLTSDNQVTDIRQPSDSIGKDRLGKDSIGEDRLDKERIDYDLIVKMFNETCLSFPKITTLSDARKQAIRARMNQYDYVDFQRLFDMAQASKFLQGKNDRNWIATFDWLIKDANMAKVLDGNYANQTEKKDRLTEQLEMMAEWAKGVKE